MWYFETLIKQPLIFIQAFQLIERDGFRSLLRYCRPGLSDKDIPKRKTLRAEIIRRAQLAEEKVLNVLKVRTIFFLAVRNPFIYCKLQLVPSKISFTFDAWTSEPGDPYLSVTGHYIDAPADAPKDWELKTEQLAFKCIEG